MSQGGIMAMLVVLFPLACMITLSVESGYPFSGDNQNDLTVPGVIPTNVTGISLVNNLITYIAPYTFSNHTHLTTLNLNDNRITEIDDLAFAGTQIEHLQLSGNNLTEFPDLSAISTTLKTLYLRQNKITLQSVEFNGTFYLLEYVSLANNELTAFPTLPKACADHMTLDVSHNSFHKIESPAFTGLQECSPEAVYMSLNKDGGSILNQIYAGLSQSLLRLYVEHSMDTTTITTIPPFNALRVLSISYIAYQTTFPDVSAVQGTLVELSINYNPNMGDPQQKWLNDTLSMMTNLRYFQVMGNNLTTFIDVTQTNPNLYEFKINGNPIVCNCSVAWMKIAQITSNRLKVYTDLICSGPPGVQGRHWNTLSLADICDEYNSTDDTTTFLPSTVLGSSSLLTTPLTTSVLMTAANTAEVFDDPGGKKELVSPTKTGYYYDYKRSIKILNLYCMYLCSLFLLMWIYFNRRMSSQWMCLDDQGWPYRHQLPCWRSIAGVHRSLSLPMSEDMFDCPLLFLLLQL